MFANRPIWAITLLMFVGISCINKISDNTTEEKQRLSYFELLSPEQTGIDFLNSLNENRITNPYNYINLYMGGGVAIGDINNDGLQDVFLTANMKSSKLYLNKGDMVFEDITEKAGVQTSSWCTAVTMADINNDGWIDIYVCRSYENNPAKRQNLAFINNGDGTFTEKGNQLGIADENYSIASSFFDYDLDGDLDLIVGNHPRYVMVPLKIHYDFWYNPVKKFSNRLFRNDGNQFVDVTESAGILSYGHTLGLTTSDYNVDGYPDIFISVDHAEPDYIFQNNGDGSFTNVVEEVVNQTSKSSMGIDVGDVNHDIYPDIFVSEMLSEDHFREKVHMDMTNIDRFNYFVDTLRYKYYQMHNFLHLNNGNNTFSDVSQMAGVHKSDWSWSNLFMDFDNDSYQDLFVTNGYYKHVFQKDFKKDLDKKMIALGNDMEAKNNLAREMVKQLKIDKIPNYLFKNMGNLRFEKYTEKANLNEPTISTGAAYGDLDNDGDLDMVINNLGERSMLYENKSKGYNHLRVKAKSNKEINAIGSKVYIEASGEIQHRELLTTRGFQSSSEPIVHFGLANATTVDKVAFIWPDGKTEIKFNVNSNQTIAFDYSNAIDDLSDFFGTQPEKIADMIDASDLNINFTHTENLFRDYDIQILLPHKQSEYGPHIAVADFDGNGTEDLFFPAPHTLMPQLYLQNKNGLFEMIRQEAFFNDRHYEDGRCEVIDIDLDGDLDLIVSSTGYEFKDNDDMYKPRLYLNDGNAIFNKVQDFSDFSASSSVIRACDFDGDGDQDLFVGGRLEPHAYPRPGTSGLLINTGNNKFVNKIEELAPGLENIGMVMDASWDDIDKDGDQDLIVVGEWMPISIYINESGQFIDQTDRYFDDKLVGWWNTIEKEDLDNDGIDEYIVGNLGLNYKYKASKEKPFTIYAKDIDGNGSNDIVLGTYYGDQLFPVRGKSCSTEQLPEFSEVYKSYTQYASLELPELYGERLENALKYEANEFASIVLDLENGKFVKHELPREAQTSPVNGIVTKDLNADGLIDLIVAGNLYQSEIETGRAGAGTGLILYNKGGNDFEAISVAESGLYIPGDVKSLESFNLGNSFTLVAGINQDKPKFAQLIISNISN